MGYMYNRRTYETPEKGHAIKKETRQQSKEKYKKYLLEFEQIPEQKINGAVWIVLRKGKEKDLECDEIYYVNDMVVGAFVNKSDAIKCVLKEIDKLSEEDFDCADNTDWVLDRVDNAQRIIRIERWFGTKIIDKTEYPKKAARDEEQLTADRIYGDAQW